MAHSVPETATAQLTLLDDACEEVGRDPVTIMKTIGAFVAFPGSEDDPGGIHANSIVGAPEQVAERLFAMHQAGIEHVNLFASPWGLRAVEQLGETIRHLRALGA
jgi:alkanesulfonate monooxygenase SsuD/methylene tetrahydromethanopterin reductase-like flavin-dependent oxidoreductase (luciferase family)